MEAREQDTWNIQRIRWLARICVFWGVVILLRLVYLQIFAHDTYRQLANSQQQRRVEIRAPRGEIVDRNGERLAMSLPVDSVCINPLKIPDPVTAATLLARVLELDQEELLGRIAVAVNQRRGFLWVKRKLDPRESQALRSYNLDWIEFRTESRRFYPKGALASPLIGSVDHEEKGNAGLEQGLNAELQGIPGVMRTTADVRGGVIDRVVFSDPRPGKRLRLTIDERLQFIAERELRAAILENKCHTGTLVVMDPNTGDILAMANALEQHEPFDPNKPLKPGEPLENRANLAVSAPFEPGSVFKVITVAGALDDNRVTPNSRYHCGNGRMTLFKRVVHDHDPYGWLTVTEVLAKSSNVGAIKVGLELGPEKLWSYVRRFGFGQPTGLPLPGESRGFVRNWKNWHPAAIGSVAMGHEILTTSVQLAQACTTVANGGIRVQPRLVLTRQKPGEGEVADPPAKREQAINATTAAKMRLMMREVVLAGTGKKAQMVGYSSAGKTGSAQIFDFATRTYTHKYNASFMGFAPVNQPRIVVVVTLNGASKYGGAVAAPVFEKVASAALRLLDVPKDLSEVEQPKPGVNDDSESDLPVAGLGDIDPAGEFGEAARAAFMPPPPPEQNASAAAPAVPERVFGPLPPPPVIPKNAIKTPDFQGKTLRAVLEQRSESGVRVEFTGTGIARLQEPAPGEPLMPGARVRIHFAR